MKIPQDLVSGRSLTGLIIAVMISSWCGYEAKAVTTTWDGTGDWFATGGNWDPSVPVAGDTVVINSGSVLLTNSPPGLIALTVGNATLTFSNWSTTVNATNVTLESNANVTLPGDFTDSEMSNRVHFIAQTFTMDSGSMIDADGLGYYAQNGPGKPPGGDTIGPGAGHGGRGGNAVNTGSRVHQQAGPIYGSTNAPVAPGSGGGDVVDGNDGGGSGGGAVRIDAVTVTVSGTISANGADGPIAFGGGGSGARSTSAAQRSGERQAG